MHNKKKSVRFEWTLVDKINVIGLPFVVSIIILIFAVMTWGIFHTVTWGYFMGTFSVLFFGYFVGIVFEQKYFIY